MYVDFIMLLVQSDFFFSITLCTLYMCTYLENVRLSAQLSVCQLMVGDHVALSVALWPK